jgi:hypothetical protein
MIGESMTIIERSPIGTKTVAPKSLGSYAGEKPRRASCRRGFLDRPHAAFYRIYATDCLAAFGVKRSGVFLWRESPGGR